MVKRGKIPCRKALETRLGQGVTEVVGNMEPNQRQLQASFALTSPDFGPFFSTTAAVQRLFLLTRVILTSGRAVQAGKL